MSLFASVDVGNALCKAVRGPDAPIVFPNMVARDSNSQLLRDFQAFTTRDPLVIEMDGLRWLVGYSAEDFSRTPRAEVGYARYDSPDYRALLAGLLAEMYPQRGGTVALTFSLPVDGFGRAETMRESLAGQWSVTARGRNLNYALPYDDILAVPESFGSLCYFLLSPDGSTIVDIDLAETRVAVIDIGGYTVDILTFRALEITPVHGSVEHGAIEVREAINRDIKHRFQRHGLEQRDLEHIMARAEDGRHYYRHAGQIEDVTDIVEGAVWDLTSGVVEIWTNQLRSGLDYDTVIFTGGGAPLIRPFLENQITHGGIRRVDDRYAHVANAIGAWRFTAFRRS